MSGRMVIHRQRPLRLEDQFRGPFSMCRSFLQHMSWILDNWEETITPASFNVGRNEVAEAENTLYDAKQKLWTLCVSVSAKLESERRQTDSQGDGTVHQKASQSRIGFVKNCPSAVLQHANNQMVVHDNPGLPIGLHQHESRKTVLIKSNATHPPLKNLLLDWYVVLDPNNRLCLHGNLLNEGDWMTSPIAVRLGPNTVQTSSGTVYNIAGKMMVSQDVCLPKFVQDKFLSGFPTDWESVLRQWVMTKSKNSENEHPVESNSLQENYQNLQLGVVLPDMKKDYLPQQKGILMPPPERIPKQRKQSSTMTVARNSSQLMKQERKQNTTMTVARNSPQLTAQDRKQNSTMTVARNSPQLSAQERKPSSITTPQFVAQSFPKEAVSVSEPSKNTRKPKDLDVPRFSKRIISRSLREISMNDSNPDLNETITEVDEVKLLSHWNAELSEEAGGVILKGCLITEKGQVLKNDYTSACIYRRLQSDLVETNGGDCYRLVGPSAAVFSDAKTFDYGFPARWKTIFLNKNKGNKSSKTPAVKNKGNSLRAKRASIRSERNDSFASSVASTAQNNKRQSLMIQQLIKQQISQSQTGMLESNSNLSSLGRKRMEKRTISNAQRQQENAVLVKKRRTKDAVAEMNPNSESVGNVSDVSEYQWKQGLVKTLQTTKNKPAEPESASKNAGQNQESDQVSKKNAVDQKSVGIKKGKDKYVIGLVTDCESDFDFDIF